MNPAPPSVGRKDRFDPLIAMINDFQLIPSKVANHLLKAPVKASGWYLRQPSNRRYRSGPIVGRRDLVNALFLGFVAIFSGSACAAPAALAPLPDGWDIVPRPASANSTGGPGFALSSKVTLWGQGDSLQEAERFAATLGALTGENLTVDRERKTAQIRLVEIRSTSHSVPGSYHLSVGPDLVVAEADNPSGLFYASQTLLQLARRQPDGNWWIPSGEVEDQPRFRWRGLLVDVSNHFQPKEAILRIIDQMAYYKMNMLQLHLTDNGGWRIEIPQFPKLTSIGARGDRDSPGVGKLQFYTADDVREIVAYAGSRFITVVPGIEMPGHSAAAARAYPEYYDGDRTLNPAASGVFDFIATIVDDVAGLFPGPYLHFSGDEVQGHGEHWTKMPDVVAFMKAKGLADEDALESYVYRRIAAIVVHAGRCPMAWDEASEAGIPRPLLVQWWRKKHPDVRDRALAAGYEVVLSPSDQIYLDYAAGPGEPGAPWDGNDNGPTSVGKILRWEPVPDGLPVDQSTRIVGIEAALWTEFIRTEDYLQFMLYPRLAAVAEVAWGPPGPRDIKEFDRRMVSHMDRFKRLGINARTNFRDAWRYITH
ncbi:MAG TPA: beta-N-acetylhexosaminidase [Candidatus Baltobacteraceae bacterium]|nr:beta-N-acetylhexosaminidase [Candidatus Baltobacteraceae bacterium]